MPHSARSVTRHCCAKSWSLPPSPVILVFIIPPRFNNDSHLFFQYNDSPDTACKKTCFYTKGTDLVGVVIVFLGCAAARARELLHPRRRLAVDGVLGDLPEGAALGSVGGRHRLRLGQRLDTRAAPARARTHENNTTAQRSIAVRQAKYFTGVWVDN